MSTPEFKRSATLAANQVYSSLDCSHYNATANLRAATSLTLLDL